VRRAFTLRATSSAEPFELFVGVQNVLDKHPPTLSSLTPTGTYSPYGDPRLRRYTIGIKKNLSL
jgi:outer membrane receptor protein involved in Fe transport